MQERVRAFHQRCLLMKMHLDLELQNSTSTKLMAPWGIVFALLHFCTFFLGGRSKPKRQPYTGTNRWQEQQFSGDDHDGDKENIFHISKKWQNLLVFATCGGAQGTVLFIVSETKTISYYTQPCSKLYIWILHKPYANEVILTGQKLSIKCC